ncbi:hypothetical protein C0389_02740 [bacterium]|nr:hypothetical protein [bacterium]
MIEIKNISRKYSSNVGSQPIELKDISFQLIDGKITSILAPADSGTSLLLKIISGLEEQTTGEVLKPVDAKIIYIPSTPSSFPWLNVFQNVKFGLDKWNEKEINEFIRLVGLEGYEKFYPDNKSLGFRFRIALARSLANNPSAILLDEPFNQMDYQTKQEMYSLVRAVNGKNKTTFLLSTSNITEAIFVSDKIYLMKNNPVEIFSDIHIDIPHERDRVTYTSEKFILLKTQIENSFNKIDTQKLFHLTI